jgi:NADH-quinone oxidoreductase subunit H
VVELASDYPVPPLDLSVPTPSRHKLRASPVDAGQVRKPALSGGPSAKETEDV